MLFEFIHFVYVL